MTFYRKYRPQTLDEVIGQTAVKEALKSAISNNRLSHAYLFCGPRGTGKTSTARILAKIINCESQESNTIPCNQCSTCLSITDGTNLDVIEMDAASNRGIEDIRSLRENIKLAPTAARKKVYIIDEVHMLTGEAFNALLKTLEEPPSHVVFILATTDPQKIPQTILSRVQRYDFKLATVEELVESLKRIAQKENLTIDEESLLSIAKKADGSFRDGVKYLDQLSSYEKITTQIIEEAFGLSADEKVLKILESIVLKDSAVAIKQVLEQIDKGINPKELNLSLLDMMRQVLLIKNGLELLVKKEVKDEIFVALKKLAEQFEMTQIVKTITALQQSLEQIRYVSIPSLPLEVAVVESCLERIKSEELKIENVELDVEYKSLPSVQNNKQSFSSNKQSFSSNKQSFSSNKVIEISSSNSEFLTYNSTFSSDVQKIQEKWTYVLETVRQNNFSLEALLRSAKIKECTDKEVVMAVPYSFHQRILETPKSRELIEAVLSDILERPIRISTVLVPKPMAKEDIANVEVAQDDEIVRLAAEIFSSDQVN